MHSRHRQQGLSAVSILIIILVAVFFATCAIKLTPAYTESYTVRDAVGEAVRQAKADSSMSDGQIRSVIGKQFQVNMVRFLNPKDVKITHKNGRTIINASYEKRVPLMFNIDVILKFDNLIYEF